jgi:chemotaxis protein MotB
MSKQFGGDYTSPNKELAKFVTEVVQEAGIDSQAIVKTDGVGVSVSFQSTLFFETLSADVKPEGRAILDKLAKELAARQKAEGKLYQIVVEGHTDSRPVTAGSFPSNWELSGARASRVVRYFLDDHFTADHLTAIGYADTRPQVDARRPDGSLDEELLAKNRRVVLRILDAAADSIPFPKAESAAQTAAAAPIAPAVGGARAPASAPAAAAPAPVRPASAVKK